MRTKSCVVDIVQMAFCDNPCPHLIQLNDIEIHFL